MRPTLAFALAFSAATLFAPLAQAAGASDTEQERNARWQEIAKSIFGDKTIESTDTLVKIEAPKRAEDAALVPITLSMPDRDKIKSVSLIIDDNPAPYAAKFEFGPAADTRELKLRVRGEQLHGHARRGGDAGRQTLRGEAVREGLRRLLGAHGHERRGGHEGHGRHAHEVRGGAARQARRGDADDPPPELLGHADEPGDARFHAGPLHRQGHRSRPATRPSSP